MHVETILFDWGGTLVRVSRQTEALRTGALEATRILTGTPDGEACARLVDTFIGAEAKAATDPERREVDTWQIVARWASSLDEQADVYRVTAAGHALGRAWIGSLDVLPGAMEAVERLRKDGYRLGLVSNCSAPPAYCHQELARQGFGQLLDLAVFSSSVGFRKPSQRIYDRAIEQAYPVSRPPDLSRVLFVGDSPAFDVIAPAQLGMRTVLVSCETGVWPEADYARCQPDLHVDAVSELPAALGACIFR
jgi:FMN phosphatase YigB (HAD superfamily)